MSIADILSRNISCAKDASKLKGASKLESLSKFKSHAQSSSPIGKVMSGTKYATPIKASGFVRKAKATGRTKRYG